MPNDTDIRLADGDHVVERHGSDNRPTAVARAPFDDVAVNDASGRMLRLPSNTDAPRQARSFVVDTLSEWDRAELIDAAVLVVSELVANAVRYGGADLTVTLSRQDAGVRIAVGDSGPADPTLPDVDRRALGGRGLRLIAALASDWGYLHKDSGKIVWAILSEDRLQTAIGGDSFTRR